MDYRRHFELAQLFIDRVPVPVGQRRVFPPAARRVGVEVDADETQLGHDAFELGDAVLGRHARKLRQLADGGEIAGQQGADAVDEVVGNRRPLKADRLGADVMRHAAGARREDREIAAAFLLELELRLDALDQHFVADPEIGRGGLAGGIGQPSELLVAEQLERLRLGRVMAVDIDDHGMTAFWLCCESGEGRAREGNLARLRRRREPVLR